MATSIDGIKTSRVSPRFLHGNSTSHTWLFSAFAELIDNAYDPDVNASELWIDVRHVGDAHDGTCITFVDNGNGMTPDKLFKMLSFGYCEKVPVGNLKPIGFYGNGFKSGSMRIGKDAMVFTRCTTSMSVGMLSQTYLSNINADAVIVPIVTWDLPSKLRQNTPDSLANMKAIMRHSIFKSEHQLISELKSLEKMKTGTSIIIYNLKKDKSGTSEIDFESDKYDLRNPETQMIDLNSINRPINKASPEYKRSLREYCSILYLKPRMKIVIRGRKVSTKLISKSLSKTETDVYKPTWTIQPIRLTFGFTNSEEESESYGLMMYHKNRLIKAYEKIGCQKQANNHGVGVVGVVEANFLEPIHNKQDFNRTEKYSAFMQNAAKKLDDYYYEKTKNENPDTLNLTQLSQLPDWTWAQCDNCLSWRRLPTGYTAKLPDKWYCRMNPDAAFNRCDIPEEPEDEDEALQPTYRKTYKKSVEERKRKAKMEEAKRLREKEESLKQKERQLKEKAEKIARKQAEKEAQLQKKAEQIANQNQELETVSSSQDLLDRKPTLGDLEKARKSIINLQQEMKEKERTILDLEMKKKQIEEKSQAMLRMADSLKVSTDQGASLIDQIEEMTASGSSKVTSSSGTHGLRAPKRKHEMSAGNDQETEPVEKIVKIKTEDGGSIPVKIVQTGTEEMIDLTFDEADLNISTDVTPENDSEGLTEMEDIKPDKEVLDKEMEEMSNPLERETVGNKPDESKNDEVKSNETKTDDATKKEIETDDSIKKELETVVTIKKELVSTHCQTVPTVVKFANPEEVDLLKLCPLEQKDLLLQQKRELDETKKSLSSIQLNIQKLLKIIVPDFEYGEPRNIEGIILDFIRANEQNTEVQS